MVTRRISSTFGLVMGSPTHFVRWFVQLIHAPVSPLSLKKSPVPQKRHSLYFAPIPLAMRWRQAEQNFSSKPGGKLSSLLQKERVVLTSSSDGGPSPVVIESSTCSAKPNSQVLFPQLGQDVQSLSHLSGRQLGKSLGYSPVRPGFKHHLLWGCSATFLLLPQIPEGVSLASLFTRPTSLLHHLLPFLILPGFAHLTVPGSDSFAPQQPLDAVHIDFDGLPFQSWGTVDLQNDRLPLLGGSYVHSPKVIP